MKRLILLIIICVNTCFLIAQRDSVRTGDLQEVVVHEQRLGIPFGQSSRSIEVLTQQKIQQSTADNVAELLTQVAGIDVRQRGVNGVQSDIGIRGGTFDQTLVLIDGIKLTDPQTGHHSMNIPVAMENIERIEVLKGAAARIYGANGFAGAINIVTKRAEHNQLTVRTELGEHDLHDLSISNQYRAGKWSNIISVKDQESSGYKYNTDYHIRHYNLLTSYGEAGNRLSLVAGHSFRKFGANGFYASPDFMDQYEETRTTFGAVSYEKLIGDWMIMPKVSYRRNHDDYVFIRSNPAVFNNIHTSQNYQAELQARSANRFGIFQAGVDFTAMDLESSNLGAHDRAMLTFNAEQRFLLLDERLDITPGVAYTVFSDLDNRFFPGIDIGYEIKPGLRAFANAGYTYRVPTYTDLYYVGPSNTGNADLQAEEAITFELGAKYNYNRLIAQISYFKRDGKNLIDWTKLDGADKWSPINLGDINHQGIEVSAQYQWANTTDLSLKNIGLSYTLVDADRVAVNTFESRYALEHVQHQATFNLAYGYKGFTHSIAARYVDRVNLDDYQVVDTKLMYEHKGKQVFLNISNLFSEEYRESNLVLMPERWVTAGLKIDLNY